MSDSAQQGSAAPAEEGGAIPAILAGLFIFLVAGFLLFGGDDSSEDKAAKAEVAAKTETAKPAGKAIGAREADEAQKRAEPRINPRFAREREFGSMAAPTKKSNEPPTFETPQEEIEWWQERLEKEKRMLAMRERALGTLPRIEEQLKKGNDPETALKQFERRKEVVVSNHEKQKAKVAEVEAKLAELQGG